MGVEGCVGEALSVIFPKKLAVTQADVVDLVSRAASVDPLPLLRGQLPLPETALSYYILHRDTTCLIPTMNE